jgi:hypothetical protein
MKAVNLFVNSALPPDLRDPNRALDKKNIDKLLADVALKYPDQYSDIVQHLSDTGRNAAYLQGETLSVKDFAPVIDRAAYLKQMDGEIAAANAGTRDPKEQAKNRIKIWSKYSDLMEKATTEGAKNTGLGRSVNSGARGNAMQLKAMLTTPALYTDYKDQPIPMFIRHSFAEGLRPAEYLASSYGTRRSVISTKSATARGGDFGKQAAGIGAPLLVTEDDCATGNGLDFDVDDSNIRGRVLARDTGPVKAGTVIDKHVISALRKSGTKTLIARSPMTCTAKSGICAHCLGHLPTGHFATKGYAAGITAGQSISEPVTQGALSCLGEGTLVRMADWSVKPIEQIRSGDTVLGSDINGVTFPTLVTNTWDQGMQPVQKYTYRMGATRQDLSVVCTAEHKILVNKKNYGHGSSNNNLKTVVLPAGYRHTDLAAILPSDYTGTGMHEPLAWLVGVILGDGNRWSSPEHQVCFSCADLKQISDMNVLLAPHNMKAVKCKRSYDWRLVQREQIKAERNSVTGRLCGGYRNPAKHFMLKFGLGKLYAHDKSVPEVCWAWDVQSVAAMIGGYIATDGSVYRNQEGHVGIGFGSCSRPLIQGMKDLLASKLCVYTSAISAGGKAGTGNRKHDMWTTTITRLEQIRRLATIMPPIPGVKGKRIFDLINGTEYKALNSEPFYRAKRRQVEELGTAHCYDIEVEHKDSLFVLANGLIVSNSKHTGGATSGAKKEFSGFDVLNQLVQSPETFPNKAALSEEAGRVTNIEDAPQGGKYVHVGESKHYILPGLDPTVKVNDEVEAGQPLSEGISDVSDVVRLRGLGEGRRYYVDRVKQAMRESGYGEPKNLQLEIMARASLDHAVIDNPEGMGNYLPDDMVSYQSLAGTHVLPKDAMMLSPDKAVGKHLHAPALHYTIGTQLTPSMARRLNKAGVKGVIAAESQPEFHPEMVRLRAAAHNNPDWLARMHSSYITTNLQDSAARARDTDVESNSHFAPRLAIGKDFGKNIEETGKF